MSLPASEGARAQLIGVLIYLALTIVPVKLPISEMLLEPPHAIVQPSGDPPRDLDELVASLASTA